ncbi:MAG: hypothetical protein PWP23_1601 [Candidatus Sumerlaeota bacterium]|nr:hypothetical protein [Candidatus Sumerlaeota bacterium]
MRRLATTTHARGLSLIELLLALIVTSLIIGASYAAYLTAARAWDSGRVQGRNTQIARAALDVIARQVEAALPPNSETGVVFMGTSGVIEGTEQSADRLMLSSTGSRYIPSRPGSTDLAAFEFYLDVSDKTGEPALLMRRKPFAFDDEQIEGTIEEIAPNVASFNVRYSDGVEFLDEWEEETLPKAVRVDLVLYDFSAEENAVAFGRLIEIKTR